jgi:hypothetical protein
MTAHVLRMACLGLTSALGSAMACWLAMSQGQQAQDLRMQELSTEVAALRRVVQAMQHVPGIPLSLASGSARPTAEDLDAIAQRMATLLKESGALAMGSREAEPPAPPPTLSSEQRESVARAGSLVERVVSSGRMTAEDVLEIRHELSLLRGRAEAAELRRRLVVAINQNRLIPSDVADGLP